ncbi:MAG: epoxide hydrolase family protein [Gammaproteobacteria bacterium]
MPIQPFTIAIPDAAIDDLHARLRATRWPDQPADAGWSLGTEAGALRDLVQYWLDTYRWRDREALLNGLPHRRAVIDGHGLHFIHVRGNGPAPMPLVLSHGWPSSFIEWTRVIGPLADPAAHGGDPADAFDVIVPSLPGFGFSDIPPHLGMTPRRMAALWHGLMQALGYRRFAAFGCDWGAYVTALLGLDFPQAVAGCQMGMVALSAPRAPGDAPSPDDRRYAERARRWDEEERGYIAIQGTKPQTLGYGLNDSPVGLAAWLLEKWRTWTECGGDVDAVIGRDTLLDNISLYWFTGTINSANRLYLESRRAPVRLAPGERVQVPCAFLLERRAYDTALADEPPSWRTPRTGAPPRARADRAFDVRRWTEIDAGHFPALEAPATVVGEIREFFRPLR